MSILGPISGTLLIVTPILMSYTRKLMLREIGKELLGSKYKNYAVLELKDVSYNKINSVFGEIFASIFLDPYWSLINFLAAFRAYNAFTSNNRKIPMKIVFDTLVQKNAPPDVWKAFFKNKDADIFVNEYNYYKKVMKQIKYLKK